MSTWNHITVENPGDLTADTLPESLKGDGAIWEDFSITDQAGDAAIHVEGRSKYHADDAVEGIKMLSAGRTVTWYEEWDDDEGGRRETVYRDGAVIVAESKHDELVPDNLRELIAAGRAAIAHSATAATEEQQAALVALLDALDPKRAGDGLQFPSQTDWISCAAGELPGMLQDSPRGLWLHIGGAHRLLVAASVREYGVVGLRFERDHAPGELTVAATEVFEVQKVVDDSEGEGR